MFEKEKREDEIFDSFNKVISEYLTVCRSNLEYLDELGQLKNYLAFGDCASRITFGGIYRNDVVSFTYAGLFEGRGYYINARRVIVESDSGDRMPKLDVTYHLDGDHSSDFMDIFKAFRHVSPRKVSLEVTQRNLNEIKDNKDYQSKQRKKVSETRF